jgi:hypothetical protein
MNLPEATNLISTILQSTAFNNLTTGAFGALFGALGAQAIVSRQQRRQSVVTELNNVNAALSLCFSTCSAFANAKRQHALPILDAIEDIRMQRDAIWETNKTLTAPLRLPFKPTLEFRTVVPVNVPIEQLERQIFGKISIYGRGLAALSELVRANKGLDHAIAYREELVVEYKGRERSPEEATHFYLGNTTSGGTDTRYPNSVDAINSQMDACIFFSKILADDLARYGNALRKKNAGWLMRSLPKVAKIDWSPMMDNGIFPSEKTFEKWVKAFPIPI